MKKPIFHKHEDSIFPTSEDLYGMKQSTFEYDGQRIDVLSPVQESKKHLIYLHGGGYYAGYGLRHWKMISFVGSMANTTVHCLEYPLIPHTCDDTISFVQKYYLELLQLINNDDIYFIGDSAGAGLALATIMTLRDQGYPLPKYNFMYSPYVDVTFSHPYFSNISAHDETLYKVGEVYAGNRDMKDYRVSPVYGDVNHLCPTLVITNDGDRLHHDVMDLMKKFESSDTPSKLMFYPGLYHDFVLDLHLGEAQEVHNRIIQIINE